MLERKRAYTLAVLLAVNILNYFDRAILGAVMEPIRQEWSLSDGTLGALSTAFTLVYVLAVVPLGRLADKAVRTRILAAAIGVWTVFSTASGLAVTYWQLFLTRVGVGAGEAGCAPSATSLIGDLYPPDQRARALSIFMLGLPIGGALSNAVSGWVAFSFGWRAAFLIAGLPGLLCVLAVLLMREPQRGATETHEVGGRMREGSPYLLVFSMPTMRWIIASGALHTFILYTLGAFLTPYLMRFHGLDIRTAGFVAMALGLSTIPGLALGGVVADFVARRRSNGRMLLGTVAALASVALIFLALRQPRGQVLGFSVLMGLGAAALNIYFSTVYPAIQDIIEPSLRGTAMSVYVFTMYVLGGALGPLGTGLTSDFFTRRAATEAGVIEFTQAALEPFRADGLHAAMNLIPVLGVLLTAVLFAGSRTIAGDMERLQRWVLASNANKANPGT